MLGCFSNRTRTSFDDGKALENDWTRLPVPNLSLCHWSSQLFDLPSSTDVPVLLLNQPNIDSDVTTGWFQTQWFRLNCWWISLEFNSWDRTQVSFYAESSKSHDGLEVCRAKAIPSFLSYLKTLSIGQTLGIEPATSRSTVKRSTDFANPAAVKTMKWRSCRGTQRQFPPKCFKNTF